MELVNKSEAARNRMRVKQGYCNSFYNKQGEILKQWVWGERPPVSLILGELPIVNLKQIRLDKD